MIINLCIIIVLTSILVVIIDTNLITRKQLKLQESIFKLIRNKYSHDIVKLLDHRKSHRRS